MKTKKLLIFLAIAALAVALPFRLAYSAEAELSDTAPAEPETKEDITEEVVAEERVIEPLLDMAASTAGGTEAGSVGKGAMLSPLLGESFQTDLATGSATVGINIVVPPGRKNMQPNLALSYSSNNPNGVCGVGWGLSTSSIQRSTKKGPPKYNDTDTFVFGSSGSSGELVNIGENEYRQKIETGFMKYVYDTTNSKWQVWDKNGTKYTFGSTAASRLDDVTTPTKIFAWFLDKVEDVYGNYLTYIYDKPGDGQIYLKKVEYTGGTGGLLPDKSIVFNYADRNDKLYNYRSGWKVETSKRLSEVRVSVDGSLVWKYVLDYEPSEDTSRSLLSEVTLFDGDGDNAKSLPPKKFTYQTIE